MKNETQIHCRTFEHHPSSKLELVPASVERTPDRLLNSHEVAEMLGVNVSWVKNHCTRVKPFLPHVRLGGGRYLTRCTDVSKHEPEWSV
jgi:hypothetical protein